MSYLTYSDLNEKLFSSAKAINESIRNRSSSDTNVFLSYRRKDKIWVDGTVRFLKRIGVSVYIDYLDETLDDKESKEVAEKLRLAIAGCNKFISLATINSNGSKWMPWELGLGDRITNYKNTAILPLTTYSNYWGDQEYAALYGRIENLPSVGFNSDDTWFVIYPDGTKINLKNWIKSI